MSISLISAISHCSDEAGAVASLLFNNNIQLSQHPLSVKLQSQVMGEYPKTEAQDRVAYDAIDCLTVLYSQLNEHDMWTGTSFIVSLFFILL